MVNCRYLEVWHGKHGIPVSSSVINSALHAYGVGKLSSRGDFCIPRINLRLSDKAFSIAGPRAWNSLPTNV